MVEIQVGLLLAITVVLVLLLLRLRRLELGLPGLDRLEKLDQLDRLEGLDVLAGLPGRLDRLEERLESLRPPPPSEEPPPEPPPVTVQVELADDLNAAVRAGTRELTRDVKKLLRLTGRSRAERLGSRIAHRLREQGYTGVRIRGGIPRTRSPEARASVSVDALRDGLRHRGVVVLKGNEVVETRMSPQHRMFP